MNTHSIATGNLGYPRIGLHRELKFALERFWSGEWSSQELEAAARELRAARWRIQAEAGIVHIPSNDFSLYDHVLDAAVLVGAVPARFGRHFEDLDLPTYFAMAHGSKSAPAMEMTKWFDTNYHYIVPELEPGMEFHLGSRKPVEEFLEAKALGFTTRPVLLGPVSLALLGKTHGTRWDRATIAQALVGVYRQLLIELAAAGADWVQMDEPCLGLDLPEEHRNLFDRVYEMLILPARSPKILLATYFSHLGENLDFTLRLPVAGVHLDLVRGPGQLAQALALAPDNLLLSLGVVDGRNIWRSDLDRALKMIRMAAGLLGSERIQVVPSCSLLHIPVDLEAEHQLDPGLRTWLAFARQKLDETALLARAATEDSLEVEERLAENRAILGRRHCDRRACDPAVRGRTAAVQPEMTERRSPFPVRREKQTGLRLPILPTTTIGSFPQTAEVRRARAVYRSGKMARTEYEALLRVEVERAIHFQEEIGLDVLVHGEFERNDMVEYFGEQLRGFAFTGNGWVQSYGSRCVKPPLLFGDVSRTSPKTTAWARYAQSLTELPVKGMLTGPVKPCSNGRSSGTICRNPRSRCNLHWPCATRWRTWWARECASFKWMSPPCARVCPCVGRNKPDTCAGLSTHSGLPPRERTTRLRFTRTCAIPNLAIFSMPWCAWTPMCSPSKRRVRKWSYSTPSIRSSIQTTSGPASTIYILRACRTPRRSRRFSGRR